MGRVLVVDDSVECRKVLAGLLEMAGHSVSLTESADQALDVLRHDKVDVLVTDYALPGHDGLWLIQQARTYCPTTRILVVTGSDVGDQALAAGADAVLTKPVDPRRLMGLV